MKEEVIFVKCTTKFCVVRGKCMVVTIPGELDHYTADMVRAEAECIFMKCPIKNVVFDFSGTSFMDSSGIGLITGRYRKICDLGGTIYVYGLNDAMEKIFMLSGLNTIVKKITDLEEAGYEE